MFTLNFNLVEIIILSVFAISFSIQVFYYLFFYLRVAVYKETNNTSTNKLPVSVVICARDEEENLKQFLPKVLEQDYPNFEVIVVNDRSEDNTSIILNAFQQKYSNLYVTTIPQSVNTEFGKKLALSIGLKAAKNEHILLTDADCEPASNQWINLMQSGFYDKTDFVIGYGAYAKGRGFLNKIIRYDTLFIAMQYIGFALAKIPYMGVGRNMAYRKSVFFKTKGFSSHLDIASGDDDLFINENANRKNLQVLLNPESHTVSLPNKKFKFWFKQKKRHLCTGKYYKPKHKFLLGLEPVSRLLFYSSFIASFFFFNTILIVSIGFIVRLLLQGIILYFSSLKLNEKDVFYLGIFLDILIPIINFFVYISNRKFCKGRN